MGFESFLIYIWIIKKKNKFYCESITQFSPKQSKVVEFSNSFPGDCWKKITTSTLRFPLTIFFGGFQFFLGLYSTGKTRRKFRVFLVAGSWKRFIQIKTNCLGTDFVDTLRTSGEFKLILNKRWWRIVRGVDFFLFGLRSFDGDVLWQPEELAPGWEIFTNVIKNKVTMMSNRSFPFCAITRKRITRRFRMKFIWMFDCGEKK